MFFQRNVTIYEENNAPDKYGETLLQAWYEQHYQGV